MLVIKTYDTFLRVVVSPYIHINVTKYDSFPGNSFIETIENDKIVFTEVVPDEVAPEIIVGQMRLHAKHLKGNQHA